VTRAGVFILDKNGRALAWDLAEDVVLRSGKLDRDASLKQAITRLTGKPIREAVPLERKLYAATNKVLDLLGGKWNRSAKGHIFDGDAADRIENAVLTGDVLDTRKLFQFFETPPDLCKRMVRIADIEKNGRVLEPSAGSGNILRALSTDIDKVAIELNPAMLPKLACAGSGLQVHEGNFLSFDAPQFEKFDAVIMNPPFSNGQDIAHIQHALTFLKPGGRLVAICANGPRQAEKLKPIVEQHGGTWEPLPADTFKQSGTGVNTVLLSLTVK